MNELGHDEILKRKYLARGAGDAATKAYIASKYLSEDGGSKKKKKKKSSSSGMKKGNIGIIDDEDSGWGNETEQDNLKETLKEEENEAFEQAALSNAGATFKGTSNNWQTIREGDRDDQEEEEDEEDKPVVIEQEGQRMSTGQKVGLLKGSALKEEFARAREAEKKTMERLKTESKGEGAETVYRDSSGRKTDPKMKRAEEARKRQEEIEKEARRMEWGKGLVQRQEAEAKRKELEDQKNKPMARYADDEDLNEELKDRERWNDPAAGFLTRKTKKEKGTRFMKPTYKGPWKPNRFGIPPGYRWDGVDRSTGYEDKFLLAQNQRKVRAEMAHAMSTEDM